jgi:hypothetical protein
MNTELKQRKAAVQRKRTRPAEKARPEEVILLFFSSLMLILIARLSDCKILITRPTEKARAGWGAVVMLVADCGNGESKSCFYLQCQL